MRRDATGDFGSSGQGADVDSDKTLAKTTFISQYQGNRERPLGGSVKKSGKDNVQNDLNDAQKISGK